MRLRPGSVWFEAQGAQSRAHSERGIARYIGEQLRAVTELAPEMVGAVGLSPRLPLTGNLGWLLGSKRLSWTSASAPQTLPHIFHVTSPLDLDMELDAIWPLWARRASIDTVVTLYDLIPLVFEDHYLREPPARRRYMTRLGLVRAAAHVLAISEATADDAMRLLGVPERRITVIDAGVSGSVALPGVSAQRAQEILNASLPYVRPGFMLYVGGIEYRKNMERLIEAYAALAPELRASHQMIITCSVQEEVRQALEGHAVFCGAEPGQVTLTGFVDDTTLAALYRACRLFVFPSFYEGSGLPILEAMQAGAPVLASNTSTSPEILGDLEATFDPFDVADMARGMTETIGDDALLERLALRSADRVGRYTWDSVAERTLTAYETVARDRSRRPSPRSRVALVTPWPPEQSGIADYSRNLVEHLAAHADIDIVVEQDVETYEPPAPPGTRLVPFSQWQTAMRLRVYDQIVYCMGNSHFHRYTYEALSETPGAVVAHDVRFTGFYGWLAASERPENPASRLAERIDELYGDRVDASAFVGRHPSPEDQQRLGLYLSQEIQARAEQVLVHSEYAAEILALERVGGNGATAPIRIVPYALPAARPRPPRPEGQPFPLIVSVGVVSPVKGIDTLLGALALVRDRHPQARLVMAGPCPPSEIAAWGAKIAALGLAEAVEITGHLSVERYAELLSRADLSVQLRSLFNGEASGAVADCLAAGLPVVATWQGWVAELPEDAVVGVPVGIAPHELSTVLLDLLADEERRASLSAAAHAVVRERSFAAAAEAYAELLGLA